MYYNARYYDPALGTFISPDSLVPNPARIVDYNRFLYARGNPLKYTDPSGHISEKPTGPPPGADKWEAEWYWKDSLVYCSRFRLGRRSLGQIHSAKICRRANSSRSDERGSGWLADPRDESKYTRP